MRSGDRRSLRAVLLTVQLQSRELNEALRPYTVAGNPGHLLDSERDGLVEGHYQVFELKHLLDFSDKVLVPVLLYLFRQVVRRLSSGRPSLIVISGRTAGGGVVR